MDMENTETNEEGTTGTRSCSINDNTEDNKTASNTNISNGVLPNRATAVCVESTKGGQGQVLVKDQIDRSLDSNNNDNNNNKDDDNSKPQSMDIENDTTKTSSSEKPLPNEKRDNTDDEYSLKVNPKYILTSRPSSLSPLPPPSSPSSQQQPKTTKKQRGRNKKRPRDAKILPSTQICHAILHGKECPYGDSKCKYSHDLKEILATRPEDIKEVEKGCPHWNLKGYCHFGVMCRVGQTHLDLETGLNSKQREMEEPPKEVKNVLDKDVMMKLRKNKYSFRCKRHFEKESPKPTEVLQDTPQETTTALDVSTPLPTKERKLIDFSSKIYIAPLTTVGNLPFRRIMKHFNADITCGEMALATNLLMGQTSEWALLKRHPDEDVFGIQIAAGFPDQYTRIAEVIEQHMEVDFVDLNLGCPIDLICDKGCGAALMLRENKLKGILEGMSSVLTCPITVKIRTGWDEAKPIAHNLVPKIQKWGIDGIAAVMIHGRSRLQRYSKLANWSYINQVASSQSPSLPTIPIIGNGDIFSYEDYYQKLSDAPPSNLSPTAMLGRGALIKPWLPTEIKERRHWDISSSERLDILKQFVYFGLEHWGSDQKGVNTTRRFLLEWLSFLYRYVPVGMLERVPQQMNQRPPQHFCGRDDLETLMLSNHCADWIKISEMLLGPVPEGFEFQPKHKANGYK